METYNSLKIEDIKTPRMVTEFRDNLRKYYCCQGNHLLMLGKQVLVDDLKSLSDLYRIDSRPHITPLVDFNMDDVKDYMTKSGQLFSFDGFFEKTEKYTIYKSIEDYLEYGNPSWFSVDNKILREFYVKTLGGFSGYSSDGSWTT